MESSATTTATMTTINFNLRHLATPTGVCRVIELVFGLLSWALVAEVASFHAAYQFYMFATVTPWIISFGLLLVYLFALNSSHLSSWPWNLIEMVFNGFWGVIYFVGACVLAAYTHRIDQLIAATVFAFFTAAIYIMHGFLAFKEWRGTPLGNPKSSGMQVST